MAKADPKEAAQKKAIIKKALQANNEANAAEIADHPEWKKAYGSAKVAGPLIGQVKDELGISREKANGSSKKGKTGSVTTKDIETAVSFVKEHYGSIEAADKALAAIEAVGDLKKFRAALAEYSKIVALGVK